MYHLQSVLQSDFLRGSIKNATASLDYSVDVHFRRYLHRFSRRCCRHLYISVITFVSVSVTFVVDTRP